MRHHDTGGCSWTVHFCASPLSEPFTADLVQLQVAGVEAHLNSPVRHRGGMWRSGLKTTVSTAAVLSMAAFAEAEHLSNLVWPCSDTLHGCSAINLNELSEFVVLRLLFLLYFHLRVSVAHIRDMLWLERWTLAEKAVSRLLKLVCVYDWRRIFYLINGLLFAIVSDKWLKENIVLLSSIIVTRFLKNLTVDLRNDKGTCYFGGSDELIDSSHSSHKLNECLMTTCRTSAAQCKLICVRKCA